MNERPEATPPANLPSEELSLVEDQGRDEAAHHRAESIVSGSTESVGSAYRSSLQSASDYNESMQTGIAPTEAVSHVQKESNPVDVITEEAERIERLTKPTEGIPQPSVHDRLQESWNAMQVAKGVRVEVPESDRREPLDPTVITETQKKLAQDVVARNIFWEDYERRTSLNPLTRVGNVVSAVTGKVGDKLAEWGGQIEEGEEARARAAFEKEEAKKHATERATARRAAAVALWEASQRKIAADKARSTSRNVPKTSPDAHNVIRMDEARARLRGEAGDVRSLASERGSEDMRTPSLESDEDQESIALLAREIQLQEEDLKIQEDELHLRRRRLLLLQRKKAFEELKKRGGKPVPPPGGGATARAVG